MKMEDCLLVNYPTTEPFAGIRFIEKKLKEKEYLVVIDEHNKFHGILTSTDIVTRPHKLAIDCLTPKEIIQTDDTFTEIVRKFYQTPSEALPVFQDETFVGILEKSSAIQKFKYQMDDYQRESEISQEVKTEFLHNLSHEIRTPLNQVIGFMGLIAELSPENFKTEGEFYYSIVKKSSEQFLRVMDDLIELSRINSGDAIQLYKENATIDSIFDSLKEYFDMEAQFSNNRLKINFNNPDKTFKIYSDIKKIRQILFHLLNGSIKHAQGERMIDIGYKIQKEKIRFHVINSHISENISIITNNMANGENVKTPYNSGQNGFDFGLVFVKKLVELLEGTFCMETDQSGVLTAYLTIPYHSNET